MRTETITWLKFDELSDERKARAIEENRDYNTADSFWHEGVTEDATEIAALMGLEISNVYFRGFWSQGDGACFEGRFSHRKGILKAVKAYAPQDVQLHHIAKDVQELHRVAFCRTTGSIRHRGHYYHERSMEVDASENEEAWREVFADFALWIYRRLEDEHTYQSSDEQIAESLIANEMEFEA